jgi:opacity protein-like surface antigen
MSTVSKQILAALIAGLSLAQPISGQDRAVSIAVRGGGFNSVTDLNEAGTADFKKTGYSANATIGVDLHRYVAVRGDVGFARNELQQNGFETGRDLARLFYDAAVQVQYDAASGFKPYAFVGAGGVTLHPVGSTDSDKSKFAGTAGLGLSYTLPGCNVGLLVEGKGWLYELSELNGPLSSFDNTQFDVTWSAGLSYRIPFASSAAR